MNALNGVLSAIYILQIIVQQGLEMVDRLFGDESDFEELKLPVKIKYIHKIEIKNSISNVFNKSIMNHQKQFT